jgi:hypothetical protein
VLDIRSLNADGTASADHSEDDPDDAAWQAELDAMMARHQTGSRVADATVAGAASQSLADDSDDSDDEAMFAALDALAARRQAELGTAEGTGEATEQLTAETASECLTEVRDYYRRQVKSFNKYYIGRTDDDQRVDARNDNAAIAHRLIDALRSDLNVLRKRNDVELGQYLVEQDIRYGACEEMTAVAAYMTSRRSPGAELYAIQTSGGFPHRFLIAGPLPQQGPIQSWASHPTETQTYAIDAWMNISCHLADYPARVREKLNKWADGKKRILDGEAINPQNTVRLPDQKGNEIAYHAQIPNASEFINRFLQSQCKIFRSK